MSSILPFCIQSVAFGACLVTATLLIPYCTRWASRIASTRRHGCASAPYPPQHNPFLLGIDDALLSLKGSPRPPLDPFVHSQHCDQVNTYQLELFFGKKKILTCEPKLLKSVLSTDAGSWGLEPLRRFPFHPFIGPGIMDTDGETWKAFREMLMPTFSRTQIANFSRLDIHVQRLLKLVPNDGTAVNMQPLLARLGLDTATDFLFGESVESLVEDRTNNFDAESFLSATKYCQQVVGKRMRRPHWNIFTHDHKFWRLCRIAQAFVETHIARVTEAHQSHNSSAKAPGRYILLNELLKDSSDHKAVRDQLLNVFMPARDASTLTLTNVFFLLARHPNVWSKLRDEVQRATADVDEDFDNADDTFSKLKSIKYLQQVLQETLRLHPPIGMVSRVALRNTTLPIGGGSDGSRQIFVKKGDQISINYYALHRRQDLFGEDAGIFRPGRWQTIKPPHWAFLPFSGGPRHCPGQQLALAEISFTLVRFLRTFSKIENRDSTLEFVPLHRITTESRNGAMVAFRR